MRLNLMNVGMSLVLMLAAAAAAAQTTQPTSVPTSAPTSVTTATTTAAEPSQWQATVERLADVLAGRDAAALKTTIGRDVQIRNFASDASSTLERLLAGTSQGKLIGAHAYESVPATLASDLASDFQSADKVVPEQIRKDMQPADDKSARRANETAAAWVSQVLAPRKDQPVGVIVFWPTNRRSANDTSPRRAIFVLVKGQLVKDAYVVQHITFGDPLETPR
jgi:hypothetical protein